MNEKLPHEVVHDLLPSYIDGLTHETTSRMIEDHLEHCDTCRQTYENMKSENEIVKAPSRQIDYLKKIRKKTARNVAAAILATILVIGGGIGLRQYVFGKAADPQYLNTYVSQRDDRITIGGQDTHEGEGIGRMRWRREGNTLYATVYETKNGKADFQYQIDQKDVDQIWVNGRIERDQGTAIQKSIARLYDMRTESGQNAEEVGRLVTYASSIKQCTSSFDRGTLTVSLESSAAQENLESLSIRLLALVQNADKIVWTNGEKEIVSYDETDFPSIKEAYAHPRILQEALTERQDWFNTSVHMLNVIYDRLSDASFAKITLYKDGKRAYECGSPHVTMSSMQVPLPAGTYEAQIEAGTEKGSLLSAMIPIRWDEEGKTVQLEVKPGKDTLDVEVKYV